MRVFNSLKNFRWTTMDELRPQFDRDIGFLVVNREDTSANAVTGLEDTDSQARTGASARGGDTGCPCAQDQHIGIIGIRHQFSAPEAIAPVHTVRCGTFGKETHRSVCPVPNSRRRIWPYLLLSKLLNR